MTIEYTPEEMAILLAGNAFDPIIVNGLKKAGFTDEDIKIGHKYLFLKEIAQIARELLNIWNRHSEAAFARKKSLIWAAKMLYPIPKSEKVQQVLDAALNDRSQKKWQDVIECVSKEECEEVSSDFIKVVMTLGTEVLRAHSN